MKIKRSRLDGVKQSVAERKEKAGDLGLLMDKIMALPPGQRKKILTDDIRALLAKYGYETEG